MKFVEIQYPYMPRVLTEGARIQHAEDILFWEGSAGAQRVINSLEQMSKEGHKDVTVKWDGSPAVIFGRDEAGNFILTDKSGFTAKGYDGRSKSAEELEAMLKARKGYQNNPEGYGKLVDAMVSIYPLFEQAVPADYRGFFKGDMLYFTTPELQDGQYVFKPQLVQYSVDANSELGKKIGASKTGVVIHRQVDPDGTEQPLQDPDIFQGSDVLVVPPVTAEKPVKVDTRGIDLLKRTVSKYGAQIDDLLNPTELAARQLKNLPDILYSYCNSKVDTDFSNLGADFMQWLESSKLTQRKRDNLTAYLQEHQAGFQAVWVMYNAIVKIKDDIVNKFDSQGMAVKQSIPGHGEGGEGYVLAHPEGDIKLVPREFFSKANRAVQR
jgi:hypothetical protein